jgi:ATP-dependent DNA helicase DinG
VSAPTQAASRPPSVADLLTADVRARMRAEIEAAGGAEVAFFGRVGLSGAVAEVEVAGRGHESAAPALVARADGWDVALHNHPSGRLLPSDADLDVATQLAGVGCGGFYIVDNAVDEVYVVVPARPPSGGGPPLEPEEIEGFLGPGGPLASALGEGYEPRPGQLRMAHQVAASLVEESIAVVESGTGTGKTFAYLAPAALHALRQRERVVVSTATINLQSQLIAKDVPHLVAALPSLGGAPALKAVVVKGRGNYVSLRRAEEAAAQDPVGFESEDERAEVLRLAEWARTTATGDRSELEPPPRGEAWDHVASQADNCLGARCPRFGECHYYDSRRRAASAQLLVVNHHLLFADLAIKQETGWERAAALPPFTRVILDEAHHVEAIAGDHFGAQATQRGLSRPLGRLRRKRRAGRGLLPAFLKALASCDHVERLARSVEGLLAVRDRVAGELEEAFAEAAAAVREALPPGERGARSAKLRLQSEEHRALLEPLAQGQQGLALLAARLTQLLEEADGALDEAGHERVAPLLRQLKAVARRLTRGASTLRRLLDAFDPAREVRWVELTRGRRGRDRLALRSAPLEVGPLLRAALFEPARSCVLSSATLTVGGGFDYLLARLGLDALPAGRVRCEQIPSPFDYDRQALLGIPTDIPLPEEPGYPAGVARAVGALVRRSEGRAFVLFTSYGALDRAHAALERELEEAGLVPLRQGSSTREALLARFRETPGAVLFGTDSFWEGVDVPGDDLVLVVIARLPFSVPSEPLQQARAEAVEARGGSAFRELQLPRAVLKLTQGFGRLIRTSTDQGAVVVLDRRLITRWYGRAFFDSLPPVRVAPEPLDELVRTLGRYVL